jgi:RNA polymerase sigma-70 factor (ECF subfamily)
MPDIDALIKRWQGGDQRAAEALYNAYRESTFRLAYALLGEPAEAEDAAQEALVHALVHIERYDPTRASFSTWLHVIAVSRCRQRLRRRRSFLRALTRWLGSQERSAEPAPRPENQAIRDETAAEVVRAVQALSPPLREAIVLRYWAGHTYQEIAEIAGCPMRTAQSRVRLAHARLRQALAPSLRADLEETVP